MENAKDIIVELLKNKSTLKQDVFANTKHWFRVFKEELNDCIDIIKKDIDDPRIRLKVVETGGAELRLFIGSDVLIFHMHTNVFRFNNNSYVHKSSYIKTDQRNAYCGIINIYNFLADSYDFNRSNDYGYLLSRIFINRENHFMVEGKGQLGFKYKDFLNQIINKDIILDIIMRVSAHAIDFDLLTPPYDKVQVVSVQEMQTLSSDSKLKTGKRLGFKFKSDNEIIG
jgi:hypothetical protein